MAEPMTPERKRELEAKLQTLAEQMVVEALCDLRDEKPLYLGGQMQGWGLTMREQEQMVVALRDFFDKVAEGLARNWGLDQSVRVKVLRGDDG